MKNVNLAGSSRLERLLGCPDRDKGLLPLNLCLAMPADLSSQLAGCQQCQVRCPFTVLREFTPWLSFTEQQN